MRKEHRAKRSYFDGPPLACNGIVVVRESERDSFRRPSPRYLGKSGGYPFVSPNLSVFDSDGNLPLVLQRTRLATSTYPFQQELFEDVIRDWAAFFLVYAPEALITSSDATNSYRRTYPGLEEDDYYEGKWRDKLSCLFCSAEEGVYPADSWNIRQGKFHKFLIATASIVPSLSSTSLHHETGCGLVIPLFGRFGPKTLRRWIRFALCGDKWDQDFGYLRDFNSICRRMVLSRNEYSTLENSNIIASYLWDRVKEESSDNNWVVVRAGDCGCRDHCDLLKLANTAPPNAVHHPTLIEWHLAEDEETQKDLTPLAKLWEASMISPHIPYDIQQRRSVFSAAFTEMKALITGNELRLAENRKEEAAKAAKQKG